MNERAIMAIETEDGDPEDKRCDFCGFTFPYDVFALEDVNCPNCGLRHRWGCRCVDGEVDEAWATKLSFEIFETAVEYLRRITICYRDIEETHLVCDTIWLVALKAIAGGHDRSIDLAKLAASCNDLNVGRLYC